MPFRYKDLEIALTGEGEGGNEAWVVMIGCGAPSVPLAHGAHTQHYERTKPIDQVFGLKTERDLRALEMAVQSLIIQLGKVISKSQPAKSGKIAKPAKPRRRK